MESIAPILILAVIAVPVIRWLVWKDRYRHIQGALSSLEKKQRELLSQLSALEERVAGGPGSVGESPEPVAAADTTAKPLQELAIAKEAAPPSPVIASRQIVPPVAERHPEIAEAVGEEVKDAAEVPAAAQGASAQTDVAPEMDQVTAKVSPDTDGRKSARQQASPPSSRPAHGALESLIGGQWAVWVGGIALALGGIFLVRYSIEAGLVGPRIRLTLAALFGLALLVAGEFIRRRSIAISIAKIDSAYVPGILTAVGSMVLFAAIYAAYGVFGFIGPAAAIVLMGVISLATLALALLHGPSLAALGLLGSYVTPVLVNTSAPDFASLFTFLLVVTFAALALAHLRQWVWLVAASAAGALAWAMLSISTGGFDLLQSLSLKIYLVALGVGFSTLGVIWNYDDENEMDAPVQADTSFATTLAVILAAIGLVIVHYVEASSYALETIAVAAIVIVSIGISAWLRSQIAVSFSIGAAIGLVIFTGWSLKDVQFLPWQLSIGHRQLVYLATREPTGLHTIVGLVFAALTIIAGTAGVLRRTSESRFGRGAIWWALPAAIVPLAAYSVSWISLGAKSSNWQLLFGAMGVSALALATELVIRRAPSLKSQGLFDVFSLTCLAGGGALLAIATLVFNFDGAMLVGLLAALALVISGLSVIRPVQALRYAAAAVAAVAIARVVLDPTLGLSPAPRIIFNSILPAYGLPVLALGLASWLLAKWGKDAPQRFLEGAAVLFAALLFTLEIRHGMNGGNILSDNYTLGEQAAHTITALVMSGAMMRLDERSPSIIFRNAMQLFGYLSLAMVIVSHGLLLNPIFTNEATGEGMVFNLLLIAYLLPGAIAAIVYCLARSRRSTAYLAILEATAWLLLSAFVSLTIRRIFVGEHIGLFSNDIAISEAYTHSIAGLAIIVMVSFAYRLLFGPLKSQILPAALALVIVFFLAMNFALFMPYQHGLTVGNVAFFNLLLPGFLLPAALLLAIRHAWKSIDDWRIPNLSRFLGGLALASVFAWATFTVRHAWHGSALYPGAFFSTETYAYSAVWLALGVGILLLSGWRNAGDLRIASAVVIFAAVLKVFLFDMSALEGALRALSFIGLGIVLIGIGLFYQRLLFKDRNLAVLAEAKGE